MPLPNNADLVGAYTMETAAILDEDIPQFSPVSAPQELAPDREHCIREELLSNSIHFPLANLLFEYFQHRGMQLFSAPESYVLVLGALLQASVIGSLRKQGRNGVLLGNLICPTLYIGFEFIEHGAVALQAINHQLFFGFALAIGVLQHLQLQFPSSTRPLTVLEVVLRTSFILAMYAVFALHSQSLADSLQAFAQNMSAQFVALTMVLTSLIMGLSRVSSRQQLNALTLAAKRLHYISVWSWGRDLVSSAVNDPKVLRRRRIERYVLFLDIRGFTAWCDAHSPEEAFYLLNRTFDALEQLWAKAPVVRAKMTGDELMLVLDAAADIVPLADALKQRAAQTLHRYALDVGVGVHFGAVLEGLVGSRNSRSYDVLGDTVNVAARLCSAAAAGESLFSEQAIAQSRSVCELPQRDVLAKGKPQPLRVRVSKAAA